MDTVYNILKERGFIEQVTDSDLVQQKLKDVTVCYIGFDPTANSLHVGSLLPIMAMVHMQRAGHVPIALIGGGTAMIGDPSGKTQIRPIMTREEIASNAEGIKKQLSRFIDFKDGKALLLNNADWLSDLKYIDFLRDIGRHFSVNRMLAAESYKMRLKTGLNFIEFNYMLLQAYDFWFLFKRFGCSLQMGGNDQWGNILAGVNLIRRLEGEIVHGLTLPLLITSRGIKMGKTHEGAVWLDPSRTSPYEYYQYWINQDDRDVARFLSLFTLLPMEEIRELALSKDSDIRKAKEILAYETTKLCHGQQEADKARETAGALFGKGGHADSGVLSSIQQAAPSYVMSADEIEKGVPAYILFQESGICKTRGEARRLISQGGGYINGNRIESFDQIIGTKDIQKDSFLLRAGKKRYMRITVQ